MADYKDYYKLLGVSNTASQKEIKRAFRKLAAKYHPDKNPDDPKAEDKFKEINEAYMVLGDEEKRKYYDQFGSEGPPPFASGGNPFGNANPENMADMSDFFQTLFGGGFSGAGVNFGSAGYGGAHYDNDPFGQRQARQARLSNVEAQLEIDLLQAFEGGTTTISLDNKRLDVNIPKGIKDGSKLRLKGQAPNGADLILIIKLREHPIFKLEGNDVRVKVNVPDYRAVLGGPVRVPTLSGDVEMTLPKGTQNGKVLRLKGQGWPNKTGKRGNELAEIDIVVPTNVDKDRLELYKKLEELDKK